MWETVVQANSIEELRTAQPTVTDLSPGTKGRVVIVGLPWETARLFDLWGAEQTFGMYLTPEDARVIDCYERDGIAYCEFEVTGTPLIPIILAIAAALVALGVLGLLITVSIQISKVSPTMFSWQIVLVIAMVIAAIIVVLVLVARSGRIAAGPIKVGK